MANGELVRTSKAALASSLLKPMPVSCSTSDWNFLSRSEAMAGRQAAKCAFPLSAKDLAAEALSLPERAMAAAKPGAAQPARKRARGDETKSWGALPEAVLLRVFIKLTDAVDVVVAGEGDHLLACAITNLRC